MKRRMSTSSTSAVRVLVLATGLVGLGAAGVDWAGVDAARPEPVPARQATETVRPNILWITSEDNGPRYGAYGDSYATTPNIDRLAARGYGYRVAWSVGPVCGASRTALITGVYPASTGGEHMRSNAALPARVRLYPSLLREAGYYVTNNAKTDYNYPEVGPVWDESSGNAHWRNRPRASRSSPSSISTTRTKARRGRGRTPGCTTCRKRRCLPTCRTCRRHARDGRSSSTRSPRWTPSPGGDWPSSRRRVWSTTPS